MPLIPVANTVGTTKPTDIPKFGTVVANNDPLQIGRVKVNIPGMMDGPAEQLPWVRRKQDTSFCGQDCEIFDVPEIGSIVEVRWNYDETTPFYSGAPCNQKQTSGIFTNNYPYESGIKFGQMYIKFDKGSNVLTISNTKAFIQLDPMGNISLTSSGNIEISSEMDINITAPSTNFNGSVHVKGGFYCEQGANGSITTLNVATVAGGLVTGVN